MGDILQYIKILDGKPIWPLKENVSQKVKALDIIKNKASTIDALPLVAFLSHRDETIRNKVAETLIHLSTRHDSLQARANSSVRYFRIDKNALDQFKKDFSKPIYLQLLGIASLNSNGYVREKAVHELGKLMDTRALKFLLFRLADWVAPVRKAAFDAVTNFMQTEYADAFLAEFPMIEWLLTISRTDLKDVYEHITNFLLDLDLGEDLERRIKKLSDKSRLYYFRQLLKKKKLSPQDLLNIAKDKSFPVQLEVLKNISLFETAEQKELITILLHAKSAKVKVTALYATKEFGDEFYKIIYDLLSDEAASVRELSRYLLKPKVDDFSKIYLDRINNNHLLPGSLMGLAETGSATYLPIFESKIHSTQSRIVAACLTAFNKFDENIAAEYSLSLLTHPSARVRNRAVEILQKNTDAERLDRIRSIYAKSNRATKISIFKLYKQLGGWRVLGDLVMATRDENLDFQYNALAHLEKWKQRAIRLFTAPSAQDLERARKELEAAKNDKAHLTPERLKLLEEIEFYLG